MIPTHTRADTFGMAQADTGRTDMTTEEIEALVDRFDLQQPDSHMGSAYMQSEPGYGDWVRFEDHAAALTALLADLAAAVARAEKAEGRCLPNKLIGRAQSLALYRWEDWDVADMASAVKVIQAAAALPADAGEGMPINWRDEPTAIVEDDEPQIGRDYA